MELVGVLADTHGCVLPDVLDAFAREGVEGILHAGDIGSPHVIAELQQVAPVIAVSGAQDESLFHLYPWNLRLHLGGRRIWLCHRFEHAGMLHAGYARALREWRPDVVVSGYTHEMSLEEHGSVIYLNPGYAGAPDPPHARTAVLLHLPKLEITALSF
jgi:putative phosphoesterase